MLAAHAENETMAAELKALRRAAATWGDTSDSTPNSSESSSNPKVSIVTPMQTVALLLAEAMGDKAAPAGVKKALQTVVDVISKHPLLFKPDLEDQINQPGVKIDRDTKV